jgi:hypothetical protein
MMRWLVFATLVFLFVDSGSNQIIPLVALSEGLKGNPTITTLILSECNLTDVGGLRLVQLIQVEDFSSIIEF